MARRSEHNREELRNLIVCSAQKLIAERGLDSLSARAIAGDIGYTVGTLYQHFDDMSDILLNVHARTLTMLGAALAGCKTDADPRMMLHSYADCYIDFIRKNTNAWEALFSFRRQQGFVNPDWYIQHISDLTLQITDCFERLNIQNPDIDPKQAAQLTWASVHSVCCLEQSGRLGLMLDDSLETVAHKLIDIHINAYVSSAAR
ncbi:MAG: TetR/AcrR family transcriptional regulator [Pseudomonadota bacterium]